MESIKMAPVPVVVGLLLCIFHSMEVSGIPAGVGLCDGCEVCLVAHNKARQKHEDTPSLVWNVTLAARLQLYLDKQSREQKIVQPKCKSSDDCDVGENIYHVTGLGDEVNVRPPCSFAVYSWYRPSYAHAWYNYSKPYYKNPQPMKSFATVVWKDTTDLACGIGKDKATNNWAILCWYYPKGPSPEYEDGNVDEDDIIAMVNPLTPEGNDTLPSMPQDLMVECEDVYKDCQYWEHHCWDEWIPGTGYGPHMFCPRTCYMCPDQLTTGEPEIETDLEKMFIPFNLPGFKSKEKVDGVDDEKVDEDVDENEDNEDENGNAGNQTVTATK